MKIETKRLLIVPLQEKMARDLHLLSLDEDNRRFVPDEVFETEQEALDVIRDLCACYESTDGPQVYAVLCENKLVGYVQAVPLEDDWEIGYHIGSPYTGRGYATEAVKAFLPVIMDRLGLDEMLGVCLADNIASVHVMENCGFCKQFEGLDSYQGQESRICRYVFRRRIDKTVKSQEVSISKKEQL